jgi:hypothetical protein
MTSISQSRSSRITLAQSLYTFVIVSLLILVLTLGLLLSGRSDELIDEALDKAVRVRAVAAGQMIARTIESDWNDLKFLAGKVPATGGDELRGLMDGMRGDGSRISWIGYATLDGLVSAATDQMLEGADVSQRPWFTNGLRGAYAGDVNEATLLARFFETSSDNPLRFIDLAIPVRGGDGNITGVIGMKIDFAWAESLLAALARDLKLDLFLIAADGTVIVATDGTKPHPAEVQILRAAQAGTSVSLRETWPDGKDYFSSLVPSVTSGDLPSFGWRLVGRLDADTFRPSIAGLKGSTLTIALCALALLLALSAIYVRLFIRPIETLASSAQRIASGGDDHYPPDLRATAEAADISTALARLQMRTASRIRSELR